MSVESAAVGFCRVLRGVGLTVPIGSATVYAQALSAVGLERVRDVYWAGRAVLVRRPEDVDAYDEAFRAFWLRGAPGGLPTQVVQEVLEVFDDDDDGSAGAGGEPASEWQLAAFSSAERLRTKNFEALSAAELDEVRALLADLRLEGALRRSRRMRRSGTRGRRPDLRSTLRAALRSGGEPVRRRWRSESHRSRRVVVLCDVSGSMDPYARAMARFLHAAVAGSGRVEAFAVGTRLTRLTRELSAGDPDEALRRAAAAVTDWSGGTRLGAGLKAFNDRWGVRGMARGAVVVVVSDGLDRGDPQVLGEQMKRLALVAYKVIWVNPLKAADGYLPIQRGMAAALGYVGEFVEGHSVDALQALARLVRAP